MLYAVIMRFDSLREIMTSIQAEARKLCHPGITTMPSHSTLSDANKRHPEIIFEFIYRNLYTTYRNVLSPDSRKNRDTAWMKRLQIIDSTVSCSGCGTSSSSQDRQKERRHKGTHCHTCQRRSPFRHKVRFGNNQRFFHVETVSTEHR